MQTARNNSLDVTPEDVGTDGRLTAREERFACEWSRTGNKAAAYRIVYQPGERTLPGTLWSEASRISARPHVARRFAELQQQAALETVLSIREALQWQIDIATADPNEIVYVARRACRHCYGVNYRYQWKDEAEYIIACAQALDSNKQPPTDEGGYGYSRGAEPVLECPECLGNGHPESVIADTRNLQGKARKLYKGTEIKNGQLVVQLHDQAKAWEMACRMLGAFNDKLDLRTPAERKGASKLPDGLDEKETARAYAAMLG